MAGDRTIFLLHGSGTLLIVVATITLMVAIYTDYWLVSSVGSSSGFVNAGLWKACFSQYTVHSDRLNPLGLSGCYSLNDPVFDNYQEWIHPAWLKAVKGQLVTSMFLNVANLFCCAFYLLLQKDIIILPIVILNWISMLLASGGTTLYRFSAFSRDWLPLPDSNQLASSYIASSFTVFLLLISSVLHGILGLLLCCSRSRSMVK